MMPAARRSVSTNREHSRFPALCAAMLLLLGGLFANVVNASPVSAEPLPAELPTFSVPHGFKTSAFTLSLSTTTPNATIRYTTNGSTPSTTAGTVYSSPITINKTTPVRAIAYSADTTPSATVTQTYLFTTQVRNQSNTQPGWPNLFANDDGDGPYPADYEMDPEIINHPNYTNKIDNALLTLPSVELTTDIANLLDPATGIYSNPSEKSAAWERPVSIEWIDPSGATDFSQNAGLRIHGQASRRPYNTPKHSFRVYFKKAYGKGKLDASIFANQGEQFTPVVNFDQLILRNGGNRSWPYWDKDQRREVDYVNDQWTRDAYLAMGHLTPHGTYVHLYINGLYWGLYNTAERPNEKMLVSYLGGLETDYDVVVADEDLDDIPVADPGTLDAYNELMGLVAGTAPITDAQYANIQTKVDINELVDYFMLTHYIGKTDWPNHNWNMYRKRTGPDTKFRFMIWDNDSGLNKINENITLADEANKPSHIFLRLTSNAKFKQLLSDRTNAAVTGSGPLSPAACAARYTRLTNGVDQAVIAESARWGDYSRDVYQRPNTDGKSGPAYLYSRDLTDIQADPSNAVPDNVQNNWTEVRDVKLNTYCPGRSTVLINQYKANGWWLTPSTPTSSTTTTTTSSTTTSSTSSTTTTTIPGDTTTTTTTTVPTSGGTTFTEQGGQVVIEAEHFAGSTDRSAHTWTAANPPAGSSSGAMTSTPDNGKTITSSIQTTSPQLDYNVNFTTPGTYVMWVRGFGPNGSGDSAHGGSNGTVTGAPSFGTAGWVWKTMGNVTVSAPGSKTINIWMREDGASVDKLVITRLGTTPTGTGPAESSSSGTTTTLPTTTTTTSSTTTTTTTTVPGGTTTTTIPTPPGGSGVYIESAGQVAMEAENATVVARGGKTWMSTFVPSGYVGASAMNSSPNSGVTVSANITTTSPELKWPVQISSAGSYNIWVRAAGATGSDDSLYAGVNNVPGASTAVTGTSWIWKKAGTVNLAVGQQSVSVWMREDGVSLDRIVLTKSSVAPTGAGPAESPRS